MLGVVGTELITLSVVNCRQLQWLSVIARWLKWLVPNTINTVIVYDINIDCIDSLCWYCMSLLSRVAERRTGPTLCCSNIL